MPLAITDIPLVAGVTAASTVVWVSVSVHTAAITLRELIVAAAFSIVTNRP